MQGVPLHHGIYHLSWAGVVPASGFRLCNSNKFWRTRTFCQHVVPCVVPFSQDLQAAQDLRAALGPLLTFSTARIKKSCNKSRLLTDRNLPQKGAESLASRSLQDNDRGPKDLKKIMILHAGSKAQDKGDPRNHGL